MVERGGKMNVKACKTIEEYKAKRDGKIQLWIDSRFEKGCVTWAFVSPLEIEIKDKAGDTMLISLDEIE